MDTFEKGLQTLESVPSSHDISLLKSSFYEHLSRSHKRVGNSKQARYFLELVIQGTSNNTYCIYSVENSQIENSARLVKCEIELGTLFYDEGETLNAIDTLQRASAATTKGNMLVL